MLLFEYFPVEHNLHEVAIVFIGWIFPGEHVSHEALPYFFVAFPAKHGKHEGYEAFSAKYLPGWHGKHWIPWLYRLFVQSIPYLGYDGMASWHIFGVHKCGVP